MAATQPVVYVDSGIGGIPYMMHCCRVLPQYRYIYVADTSHFPYGQMEASELKEVLHALIATLVKDYNPKLIVLACNTASVTALESLRNKYSVPFVGVVPAIKPASYNSTHGKIALLVTERTAVEEYLSDLVSQFAARHDVHIIAAGGIVAAIEHYSSGVKTPIHPAIIKETAVVINELKELAIDTLVLGCTHFVYIVDYLQQQLGPAATILDSRLGVTNRVRSLLGLHEEQHSVSRPHPIPPELYTTHTPVPAHITRIAQSVAIHQAGVL